MGVAGKFQSTALRRSQYEHAPLDRTTSCPWSSHMKLTHCMLDRTPSPTAPSLFRPGSVLQSLDRLSTLVPGFNSSSLAEFVER